jgi:hypothetical protein
MTNFKQGYIYFIVDYTNYKAKIGYSKFPQQRLKQLSTGYPGKLELAKLIPGTVKDERKYHQVFCHSKICREWFTLTPEIEEFISRKAGKANAA